MPPPYLVRTKFSFYLWWSLQAVIGFSFLKSFGCSSHFHTLWWFVHFSMKSLWLTVHTHTLSLKQTHTDTPALMDPETSSHLLWLNKPDFSFLGTGCSAASDSSCWFTAAFWMLCIGVAIQQSSCLQAFWKDGGDSGLCCLHSWTGTVVWGSKHSWSK